MNMILTGLLWLGYFVLMIAISLPGVTLGFLPLFVIALVWTLIIEGLRKMLVRTPKDHA